MCSDRESADLQDRSPGASTAAPRLCHLGQTERGPEQPAEPVCSGRAKRLLEQKPDVKGCEPESAFSEPWLSVLGGETPGVVQRKAAGPEQLDRVSDLAVGDPFIAARSQDSVDFCPVKVRP